MTPVAARLRASVGAAPPVDNSVPMGLYSGTYAELTARETEVGASLVPSWVFLAMNSAAIDDSFDDGRIVVVNIHMRNGGDHRPWTEVTAGTWDANLTTCMQTFGDWSQSTVYLAIQEEMDGADGATHGTAAEYEDMYHHVEDLAAIHAPNAICCQILASSGNFATWIVPDALAYGFDPHFYTFNGTTGLATAGTYASAVDAAYDAMVAQGVQDKPMMIHTGISEPMTEAEAIAAGFADGAGTIPGNITAGTTTNSEPQWKTDIIEEMVTHHATAKVTAPNFLLATYWDRDGTVNSRAGWETVDSNGTNAGALTAFEGFYS